VAPAVVVDRVAASINDDLITLSEIYDFGAPYIEEQVKGGFQTRAQVEREVLERLIERMLVDQEITAMQLDVTDQELDRTIADIARRNGLNEESLRREVERSGMSWNDYRTQLKGDLRQMKFGQAVLRPRVTITDDELRDAYNRLGSTVPKVARVQAIFLSFPDDPAQKDAVIAKANSIRAQAVAGSDFAALSKQYDESGFGAQGGEMGRFGPGELVGDLDRVVFSLPEGGISEPLVLEQGVFLIRVAALESGAQDFETVKDQIMEQVYEERMTDEQDRWFKQARARASIRILLPE
jgi:parvulin-like peptidyl-prolyl isomerase